VRPLTSRTTATTHARPSTVVVETLDSARNVLPSRRRAVHRNVADAAPVSVTVRRASARASAAASGFAA
jgi:hypothetical protein